MAYVNEHGTSLAGLPFGGCRPLRLGRDLGDHGVDAFVNKRLVCVSDPWALSSEPPPPTRGTTTIDHGTTARNIERQMPCPAS